MCVKVESGICAMIHALMRGSLNSVLMYESQPCTHCLFLDCMVSSRWAHYTLTLSHSVRQTTNSSSACVLADLQTKVAI